MEGLHSLLKRQLKKHFGSADNIPKELVNFIALVNDAYFSFDSDRILLERSIEISSKELMQSLSVLTATLEATADGILVVDINRQVVSNNQKFLQLWRIPDSLAVTRDDNKLLTYVLDQLTDPEEFLTNVRRLYSNPDEQSFDLLRFKDGRVFERFSQPQKIGDKIIGRVWSFSDITSRKRAEEELKDAYEQLRQAQAQLVQSAKMASVGLLAGGVAHEINNPLTGVLNNVQLIKMMAAGKNMQLSDDFKEILGVMEESALRCKKITQSLLDFSHTSKGMYKPLSLNEVVDKVVVLVERELGLQNIAIQKNLQPELPAVSGDVQLLQQIIFDIISNATWAIKKTDAQAGKITIETNYDAENKNVAILISDTGIGIPKENKERIFEPFFTTKPVGEGTGLGLSIVYNIVKAHRGTISVESEVNKGATFKISFPAVV